MNTLLIILAVFVVIIVALQFLKANKSPKDFPYQISNPLLTKAERSFYGVLASAVENDGLIFSKVRVADILMPQKGLSRSNWQRAFNQISSKHFDFVVCNPSDCSVKFVVELDDSSHRKQNQRQRDRFINKACEVSGLPLLRVKASKGYVVETLKSQITQLFESPSEEETANESPKPLEEKPQIEIARPNLENGGEKTEEIKICPKCGATMVIRKAKSGKHAGKKFWGCSEFPKCRCALQLDV